MTISPQTSTGTRAALRGAEISLSVLIGGGLAALAHHLLTAVSSPVEPIVIAVALGALSAVAADVGLRSIRRRYLDG